MNWVLINWPKLLMAFGVGFASGLGTWVAGTPVTGAAIFAVVMTGVTRGIGMAVATLAPPKDVLVAAAARHAE